MRLLLLNYLFLLFQPCSGLIQKESDFRFNTSTGTITYYTGTDEVVVIPDKIGGVDVTSIGNYAFFK
ncbi:MAG: hypothetical protein MI866_02790, partial [Bacteroidales bacterium]|nr:hypothetical protein [Bacteroidales bacterium]